MVICVKYTELIACMPIAESVWAGLQTVLPFNYSTAPSSSLTMSHTHTNTHTANSTWRTCHEADWIYTASIIHPHTHISLNTHGYTQKHTPNTGCLSVTDSMKRRKWSQPLETTSNTERNRE